MIRRARLVPSLLAGRRGRLSYGYRRRLLAEAAAGVNDEVRRPLDSRAATPGDEPPDEAVAARRPAYGHPTF